MDRSRIAMLLALTGLIVVLLSFTGGFGNMMDGSFPWILFGLAVYMFSKKGGGCRGKRCAS